MHTLISILGFLTVLAHASDCEQNYVIAKHIIQANDDLSQVYNDMVNIVSSNLNKQCINSNDVPDFQPQSACYNISDYPFQGQVSQAIARTQMFCGFRLWRTYPNCDLTSQLDYAFTDSTLQHSSSLWWVDSRGPTGNVRCH